MSEDTPQPSEAPKRINQRQVADVLEGTSAAFLLDSAPITSAWQIDPIPLVDVPHTLKHCRIATPTPEASPNTQLRIMRERIDCLEQNKRTLKQNL